MRNANPDEDEDEDEDEIQSDENEDEYGERVSNDPWVTRRFRRSGSRRVIVRRFIRRIPRIRRVWGKK